MQDFNLLDEEGSSGKTNVYPVVRKPSKVQVVLAILLILLLALCILFIALYVIEKGNTKIKSSVVNVTSTKDNICWTPRCLKSAAGILQNLDTSVKPCDDFYQYTCGGFIKNNYVQDGELEMSEFVRDSDKVYHSLKELLENEELMSKYLQDPNSASYKAVNYYRSCMNLSEIESAAFQPILDLIDQHGSWNITNGNWNGDSWILEKILARVLVDLGIPVFIGVNVMSSFSDTSQNFLVIYASPYPKGRTVQKNDETTPRVVSHKEQLKGYKKFMFNAFRLLGANSASLEDDVKKIYDLESNFTNRSGNFISVLEASGVAGAVKMMTLDQLNNLTSSKFNWTVYFEEGFRGTNISVKPNQQLMILLPNNIKRILYYISDQPKSLLANTIMWNVVRNYIHALPKSLRDAANEYSEGPGGIARPRWRTCVSLTNRMLGFATTLIYTDTHLSEGARQTAQDLFLEIKNQFINGLNEQTWMDTATRTQAQIKLKAMREMVGYPSFIKDPTKLNKYYRRVQVTPFDFLQNDLSATRAWTLDKIDEFGTPHNNTNFATNNPLSVNAYYAARKNAVTIPTGILQKPFYTSDSLKALNYGRIGVVIGHEITHGFDAVGRLFDEKGNYRSWWSKESSQHFKERAQCFIKEYSNVTVFGRKVNGSHTLSENIADNGGLKYAFRAYQKWRETHGMEDRLPVVNFTNDQLFFVGYAQLWCTKYEKEAIKSLMANEHSLAPVRVRVPLFNFPEFSKAFGCKQAIKKSCSVW